MTTELIVSIEHHYGTRRVYPQCNTSRIFAQIANTETLTDDVIADIKHLGYTFTQKLEEI